MYKIQIDGNRTYALINTANATMFETLKIAETGFSLTEWDAGYAKLTDLMINPEQKMTTADLFNDGAFLRSIAISVWMARLRAGEVIAFDESLKDWSFANFKLIPPEISQFAKAKGADVPDPKKPGRTRKASAPAKKRPATKPKGSGQKI